MWRALLIGFIVLFGVTRGQSSPPLLGSSAADFKMHSSTLNAAVQLAGLKGKPVVLNFWGSWCAPCREEMPALNTVAGQLKDKFVLLAVGINESPQKSLKYLQDNGLNNLTLLGDAPPGSGGDLETSDAVADKYGVDSYPTTVFIDSSGLVQAVKIGGMTQRSFVSYLRNIDVKP